MATARQLARTLRDLSVGAEAALSPMVSDSGYSDQILNALPLYIGGGLVRKEHLHHPLGDPSALASYSSIVPLLISFQTFSLKNALKFSPA